MIVKLLTEHNLEFLSLKGCCTGSSESTHIKMPLCWKFHARAFKIGILLICDKYQNLILYFRIGAKTVQRAASDTAVINKSTDSTKDTIE